MKTVQDIMRENNSLANVERFNAMQKWDYKRKVAHAQEMAEAFYSWAREHGKNVHLSVGGLDSITLHYFLESIGLPVTCISCSSLEGRGVQEVHKRIAQEMSAEYKDWMGDGGSPGVRLSKAAEEQSTDFAGMRMACHFQRKGRKNRPLAEPHPKKKTPQFAMLLSQAKRASMAVFAKVPA